MKHSQTLATLALVLSTTVAFAQHPEVSIVDILKGGSIAGTIKAADLPTDFLAGKIAAEGGGGSAMGGMMDMIMSPIMMMMGAFGGGQTDKDSAMGEVLAMMDITWTKGDVVSVLGQHYLVTYKMAFEMADMMAMDKKETFADSVLRLTLVRTDTIKTITPRPDVTKEKFIKLLNTKIPKKKPELPIPTTPTTPPGDAGAGEKTGK